MCVYVEYIYIYYSFVIFVSLATGFLSSHWRHLFLVRARARRLCRVESSREKIWRPKSNVYTSTNTLSGYLVGGLEHGLYEFPYGNDRPVSWAYPIKTYLGKFDHDRSLFSRALESLGFHEANHGKPSPNGSKIHVSETGGLYIWYLSVQWDLMRITWINGIYHQQYLVGGLEHGFYLSIYSE